MKYLVSAALLAWATLPAHAQEPGVDLWDLRYARAYVAIGCGSGFPVSRYVPGLDLTGGAEAYSLTFGSTVGRYTSVEMDIGYVEFDVTTVDHGKIAELTLATFIPQIRLQLPLADDRLVPWISGGIGPATLTVNDRTSVGAAKVAGWSRWGWGVSADVGVQYLVAPNIGLSARTQYLKASRSTRLDKERFVDGVGAAVAAGVELYWFIPREPPEPLLRDVAWSPPTGLRRGLYFTVAFGVRTYSHRRVTQEARFDSERGGEQTTDIAIGVDVNQRVGIELAGHFHEIPIWTQAKVIEYASWIVAPEVRIRLNPVGPIVPHVFGGVGLGLGETNDVQPANVEDPAAGFGGRGLSLAGSVGVGFAMDLESNVQLLFDARHIRHTSSLTQSGRPIAVDVSGTQLAVGLRFYFR